MTERAQAAEADFGERRAREWWCQFLGLLLAVVAAWTTLDCCLDPGIEYPWGLLRVALPTSLLVAPGAAVAACGRLAPRPCGLEQRGVIGDVCAVFLGDSLTHGSLSVNFLEVIAAKHADAGRIVNCGMNMRPTAELLEGSLLEDVLGFRPTRGVVVLIGTNDLIRYTLLPPAFRQPTSVWLEGYRAKLGDVARRLSKGGVRVTLASPPILGEDPGSDEGRLGRQMADEVRRLSDELMCSYAPLYEATVSYLERPITTGACAPRSRAYSPLESFALLCVLPWRLYGMRQSCADIQREHGLELTLDLVHFGPPFDGVAADVFSRALRL